MAFEVRCPECHKLYAAEWGLVGKRIRCRKCANVFPVGPPREAASYVPAAPAVASVGESTLAFEESGSTSTGAATSIVVEKADDTGFGAASVHYESKPNLRPSRPQRFPGSDVLEAWLPLGLGLVAAVWSVSETFADNRTGRPWVSMVRLAVVVAIYFLLVVPLTQLAVRHALGKLRRAMPPSPKGRVAVTFALPATLGYVFWLVSGGIPGLVMGLILGLALMAAVFWLLFRVSAQEAAGAYAEAGGAFVASLAVGAALLVGANSMLNHVMVNNKSVATWRESPLGSALAWDLPPAEAAVVRAKTKSHAHTADEATQRPTPVESSAPPPTVLTSSSHEPLPSHPVVPVPTTEPVIAVAPSHAPESPAAPTAYLNDSDADPGLNSALFGNSADNDPFVTSIQDAKLPFVQRVFRPADEGIFERSVGPLTASPYVGLVRVAGIDGKQLESCLLTSYYHGLGGWPLAAEASDSSAFTGRIALTPDGLHLLRLLKPEAPVVQVTPLRGTGGRQIALQVPKGFGVSASPRTRGAITPELLGALPAHRFLVRWSGGNETVLQVYSIESPDSNPAVTVHLQQALAPGVYAVDEDGNSFATATGEPDSAVLAVCSLNDPARKPVFLAVPNVADLSQWRWAGIGFSPDGTKVAALLERETEGIVRSWKAEGAQPCGGALCKVPSADEMLGLVHGRVFDWISDDAWLVHGRTVLSAAAGNILGTLTDNIVTAQQVAGRRTIYLSYYAEDNHERVAVVRFDLNKLHARTVR